jgi:hypothetical protein
LQLSVYFEQKFGAKGLARALIATNGAKGCQPKSQAMQPPKGKTSPSKQQILAAWIHKTAFLLRHLSQGRAQHSRGTAGKGGGKHATAAAGWA